MCERGACLISYFHGSDSFGMCLDSPVRRVVAEQELLPHRQLPMREGEKRRTWGTREAKERKNENKETQKLILEAKQSTVVFRNTCVINQLNSQTGVAPRTNGNRRRIQTTLTADHCPVNQISFFSLQTSSSFCFACYRFAFSSCYLSTMPQMSFCLSRVVVCICFLLVALSSFVRADGLTGVAVVRGVNGGAQPTALLHVYFKQAALPNDNITTITVNVKSGLAPGTYGFHGTLSFLLSHTLNTHIYNAVNTALQCTFTRRTRVEGAGRQYERRHNTNFICFFSTKSIDSLTLLCSHSTPLRLFAALRCLLLFTFIPLSLPHPLHTC